ncbi:substrate-binding domain-containing protein [Microbispora bryophytorum]|uniref:substrate-binding domain-containing protein n=1 Tax=Microbispora bryophytorum TaxID=1460882 RepID=UPI0037203E27
MPSRRTSSRPFLLVLKKPRSWPPAGDSGRTRRYWPSVSARTCWRRPRPFVNDLQALGVYQAARELGLRIPADLSVVGFDDLPITALVDPPLTTIHQPLTEMAAAATELALALGRGEEMPQVGVELDTTLTVRESTSPPAGPSE